MSAANSTVPAPSEKSREARLRRIASRKWFTFKKVRTPFFGQGHYVRYMLVDDRNILKQTFERLEDAEQHFRDDEHKGE